MNADTIRDLVHAECQSPSNVFGPAFFDQHIVPVAHYAGLLALHLDTDPHTGERGS